MNYLKAPISSLRHSVKDSLVYADALSEFNLKITVNEYGSATKFINSLEPILINSPKSPHLKEFYKLYKEFFILPDERESLSGFKKVLALNKDRKLNRKFGDFEEAMICLFDPKSKTLLGAIDFCNYPASSKVRKKQGVIGFVQLVFLFVREDFRKFGIAKRLLTLVEEYYSRNFFFGVYGKEALHKKNFAKGNILFFCEQNNPKRMSVRKQLIDSLGAKILQDDRVAWWKNDSGTKLLIFSVFL